jgi:anthranilate phosphoribosyltransferase
MYSMNKGGEVLEIRDVLDRIVSGEDLSEDQAYCVAMEMMGGKLTDAQISTLLTALRMKGECVEEITGFAKAMREKVEPVMCTSNDLVDTCGTGGDRSGTFNVSTVAAFIAAGAGCKVAKHGNRSVSSRCGSADVLEALGVNVQITPNTMGRCIDTAGVGFLYAPLLHKAMKFAIGPRREMGIRTIFNLLGPLTNPAGAKRQLLGVYCRDRLLMIARVLRKLGSRHCLIVHGDDGLDEITITGRTFVCELNQDGIEEYTIAPGDFGMKMVKPESIQGGDRMENARIVEGLLNGADGPKRDMAVLNGGAAIYVAGKANSLYEGMLKACESLDSGRARAALDCLRESTR